MRNLSGSSRLVLPLVLVALGSALAQENKPDPKRAEQLVDVGFKFRRDGELAASSAAFDEAVKNLPEKSDERRRLLAEAYDVAWVESKWERCARLAQSFDVVKQVRALVKAKLAKNAVEIARAAKDPLAEGIALRGLEKNDEALAVLAKAGAPGLRERAELEVALGRLADAARDFDAAGEPFESARALERAGTAVDWKAALDDVKKKLEALLAKGGEGKRALDVATGLAAKERARHALADTLDRISREYERYSIANEKANDKAKAQKLAELASQFAEQARVTMTDQGKDKYGEARARQLGLASREAELQTRLRALRR